MSFFIKELESDGTHLTALSGHHFIHHVFDAAISAVGYLNMSSSDQAIESRQSSAFIESRLTVLESQFSTFKSRNDLEFAIQQELNDWQENQASEKFFVITGVPPAPAKLSGGEYPFSLEYFLSDAIELSRSWLSSYVP